MADKPVTSAMVNMPPKPHGAPDPEIKLWEDKDRQGWYLNFKGQQVNYIGDDYNDAASCVEVVAGRWELFENIDFNAGGGGKKVVVGPGDFIRDMHSVNMNDELTSLRPIDWQ